MPLRMPVRPETAAKEGAGRRRRQRGHALIEFALVSVILVPLFVGMAGVGINLTRSVAVSQVVRDAGLMYARFVDFSLPSNQDILERLAIGMDLRAEGTGRGVLIFTKVTYIDDAACAAANLSGSGCTNRGFFVMTQRLVVGNSSLRPSNYGAPNPTLLDGKGNVSNYITETSARVSNFDGVLTLTSREVAYVTEGFFKGVSFKFGMFPTAEDIYTYAMF